VKEGQEIEKKKRIDDHKNPGAAWTRKGIETVLWTGRMVNFAPRAIIHENAVGTSRWKRDEREGGSE